MEKPYSDNWINWIFDKWHHACTIDIWHDKLGHLNYGSIKYMTN